MRHYAYDHIGGFWHRSGSLKPDNTDEGIIEKKDTKSKTQKHIYDYDFDSGYICSAFMAQYGLDLQTAALHWWQCNAMFSRLTEGNKICKIMEYRVMDLSAVKDKEMKAYYRKMKRLYRLPDPRSEDEKEAAMVDALANFIQFQILVDTLMRFRKNSRMIVIKNS